MRNVKLYNQQISVYVYGRILSLVIYSGIHKLSDTVYPGCSCVRYWTKVASPPRHLVEQASFGNMLIAVILLLISLFLVFQSNKSECPYLLIIIFCLLLARLILTSCRKPGNMFSQISYFTRCLREAIMLAKKPVYYV